MLLDAKQTFMVVQTCTWFEFNWMWKYYSRNHL